MDIEKFDKLYTETKQEASQLVDFDEVWKDHEAWRFRISKRMIDTIGRTDEGKKEFAFSRAYIEFYDEVEVKKTILHEIAHALTPMEEGHGEQWKEICLKIGGDGEEYFEPSQEYYASIAKYELFCPNCGAISRRSHRRTKVTYACGKCCKKYNEGRYSDDYRLVCREIEQ